MNLYEIKNRLCRVVAAVGCCLLPFGCAQDEDMSGIQEDKQEMSLQLSVRSTANDQGVLPTDIEAKIHTLRVFAFANMPGDPKDGRLVGHYYTDQVTATPHTFNMDITFYATLQSVRFYVVANEGAMMNTPTEVAFSDKTTENELNNCSFSKFTNIKTKGLPMFYKSDKPVELNKQGNNTVPEFRLQRPMGKLEVFAAKVEGEIAELKITGLKMLASGTRSRNYLMPQSDETLKKVADGGDIKIRMTETVVDRNLVSNADRKNPANYTKVSTDPFYPFENPWGSSSWNSLGDLKGNILQIDYTFGGKPRTGLVYLPAILRNNYYAVCCLMRNDGTISVEYTVADWDLVEWKLEFDYPTYESVIPADRQITEDPATKKYPQPTIWYNPDESSFDGSYAFEFKMTGPDGQRWTPTLYGSPADFAYSVWQNGKELRDGSYPASPDPYIIKVKALKSENVGSTVSLGISYTPQWNPSESSLLLINGLTGNLKWEGSEFAETIVIKQIERTNK